jgi:hypothetical protein
MRAARLLEHFGQLVELFEIRRETRDDLHQSRAVFTDRLEVRLRDQERRRNFVRQTGADAPDRREVRVEIELAREVRGLALRRARVERAPHEAQHFFHDERRSQARERAGFVRLAHDLGRRDRRNEQERRVRPHAFAKRRDARAHVARGAHIGDDHRCALDADVAEHHQIRASERRPELVERGQVEREGDDVLVHHELDGRVLRRPNALDLGVRPRARRERAVEQPSVVGVGGHACSTARRSRRLSAWYG